ncbi:alpha/beta hydrolase-fold protein [Olleya sp. Bg11-27]|uniref:alpha/beta hydrolase-fold protein n=1 Tax=Olleya sp. Bg11-27 TaxID=2058135 RepID=UPI0012FE6F44|nr:alpha/beta hydrolase-fold protein [Olleya sp. Bg11-27]
MINFEKLLIAILLLSIISCQKSEERSEKKDDNIEQINGIQIGISDRLNSGILDQDRELLIYLPESAKDPSRKKEKYPVVYLLDGHYSFLPFVAMLKQYSELNDTKILPEMIVIAIPNIDFNSRMMDFSPTTAGKPQQYGGGNKFLEFMSTELFPYIEKNYPVSDNRTIVGHSLGGAVVMNALTSKPEMFDNYLMIDGSLSFDNELFLKNPNYTLNGMGLNDKKIFIAIANTATFGSSLESIKKDSIRANNHARHSLELIKQIEHMETDLNMDWKYYENDTHGSTVYPAQKDGFRFFYPWFEFKKEHKYRSKYFIPKTKEDRFVNLTKSHFEIISQKFGYNFKPEKQWVSSKAYMLLNFHKQPNQAKEVFELNIDYYPNDASTYKDLADFYLSQKDSISANKYYIKSLELDDNSQIREIVNKLGT